MVSDQARPFLAAQRHDVLLELIASRSESIQRNVVSLVSRGVNSSVVKLDGKAGAADGVIGMANPNDYGAYVPICGAYPGPKIEHPKGKDTKEGKEQKDGKEGKEGKESKDGKEDKDSSDGFKMGGDEVQDPFTRYGDWAELPSEAFNAIAKSFPGVLKGAIARGTAVF